MWGDPDRRWPAGRIALVLYPLAAGAVAVNLFFLALLGRAIGGPDLPPVAAVGWGAVLGVPVALWFGRYMRQLMDDADS